MDHPAWAWPAWKFGMKRDDLFTTLHDQYNTFSFTLQDPEAFHHDVYEISRDADTVDELHRLMADRQQMRLRELNESLETLAVEIIANPKLMGTEQWHHALQLFRTKSYDSIVRYFASYLPDDSLDRQDARSISSASCSESDSLSTVASSVDEAPSPFDEDDFCSHAHISSAEACCSKRDGLGDDFGSTTATASPPASEPAASEPSVSSPISDDGSNLCPTLSSSRSMSFSGSESGHIPELVRRRYLEAEEKQEGTMQPDTFDSAIFVHDSVEMFPTLDVTGHAHNEATAVGLESEDDEGLPTSQYPDDEFDYFELTPVDPTEDKTVTYDTPTPRAEVPIASISEFRPVLSIKTVSSYQRSSSPKSFVSFAGSATREMRKTPEEPSYRIQKSGQIPGRRRPVRKKAD